MLHALFGVTLTVPVLMLAWVLPGPLARRALPSIIALAILVARAVAGARANIRDPKEWDFGAFWLYGHAAAHHVNLYDPAAITALALPFRPTADFTTAVLRVGFPYPPPAIVLFAPLGSFGDERIALAVWYAFMAAAFVAAAIVLARALLPQDGWRGALFAGALIAALPSTMVTIDNAQTNLFMLLVVAAAIADRARSRGAIWSLLSVWIKPYGAFLLLGDIVAGRAKRILVAAVACAVSLGAAALALGPATMSRYLSSGPAAREPGFALVETVNQSLLAVVLRARHSLADGISLHDPVYLSLALLLVVATALLCRCCAERRDLSLALSLTLGLLVYPATLVSYGVMLIVPLLIVWRRRDALPGGTSLAIGLGTIIAYTQGPLHVAFVANLATWCALAVHALATAVEPPPRIAGTGKPARAPVTPVAV